MSGRQIIPGARQLAFQDWEYGLFIHFGLRTFYEGYVDFDERPMSPSAFNPVELDCGQWIRTAKQAGMNYAVFTAKHHDGFSNWPSAYTEMSVAHTPWKDGKGDVVGKFVAACRKYGVKPGLYYSPYDASAESFLHDGKAYDDYFVNQITELPTKYGEIDILWFDGCGSEDHEYDWPRIFGEIRRLQPNILIFNMGDPDFRWVGNEDGVAPYPCWNTVDAVDFSIQTERKEQLGESLWLPAECDVQLRANWFYSDHDEHTVKSIDELIGLYYYSVGRGANLLLNIGPDRRGLLPDKDAERILEFGEVIRQRFASPIATLADCEREGRCWTFRPERPILLDHAVIQEELAHGESIRSFRISVMTQKSQRLIPVYEGKSVGHKAICRFAPIRAREVVMEVLESNGEPIVRELSFHYVGEKL